MIYVAVLQHLNAIAVQLFCLHVAVWDAKRKGASTANKNTGGIREGDFSNVTGVTARQLLPNVWLQYEHPSPRRCKKLWENVNLWSYRSMIKMNVFWMYVHAYKYICMWVIMYSNLSVTVIVFNESDLQAVCLWIFSMCYDFLNLNLYFDNWILCMITY